MTVRNCVYLLLLVSWLQSIVTQNTNWTIVRPLSKSVFNLRSAEKTSDGDCFRFTANIQAPRNTTKRNKYSTWKARSEVTSQSPAYELGIDKSDVFCRAAPEILTSGSESIAITWVYPTKNSEQTVFPFNDCQIQILRKETQKLLYFKTVMKNCVGNFAFWPELRVNTPGGWDSLSYREEAKYYKQEDRQREPDSKESISVMLKKEAMLSANVEFESLSFRAFLILADWEVLDVTWILDLMAFT